MKLQAYNHVVPDYDLSGQVIVQGVTDWRWLPDPPTTRGRAGGDPLAAALARARASAARLGRTIEEWESKFGRNQENLR